MTPFQAFILGIVQGATEFLPISSSAHLVLIPWLIGWKFTPQAAFVFDVLVQLGTLTAVIAYYRRDLVTLGRAAFRGVMSKDPFSEPEARLAWLILAASLPAAVVGLLIKDLVESAFKSPAAVSGFLLVTAALLFLSEHLSRRERQLASVTVRDALWVGLAQALALFPGISRSGSTIAGGLIRGLRREEAARFSFLMAIPVMLGAGFLALVDLAKAADAVSQVPAVAVGFLSAAIVGYLAIRWLLGYLARQPLTPFAIYCLIVGLGGLLLTRFRG